MISVLNTLERKGSKDINKCMSFNMNHFASSYWALATFNDVQEELHGLQRPRKQLYYQLPRETSPRLQEIPKRSREIRRRKFVHGFASASLRHVTIKLCHYFVHGFGMFTSTPPCSVITEDCLITHVKHQLEWFPTVCGESNFCPSRNSGEQQ